MLDGKLLAYLAGYFDGEGSVYLSSNPKFSRSISLRVGIISGDPETLKLYESALGGTFKKTKNRKDSKRQLYRWTISGNKAQEALRQLLPYLRTKRAVAELALQPTFGHPGWNPLSNEEFDIRTRVQAEIRAINQRVTVAN